MFMSTPNFKFLDITNYVAPGTTYDKWVKTYGAELTKSWLPYEWFDTVEKLDYPELPAYWHYCSKLKNEIVLTTEEYFQCRRVWKEKRNENLCRLVAPLQQSGCQTVFRSHGKNARFLHRPWYQDL